MLVSNQSPEQNVPLLVKPDPTGKATKSNRIILSILAPCYLAYAIFYLIFSSRRDTGIPFLAWIFLFLAVFYLFILFLLRKQAQAWKHYEQRRQLAAQGNREQVALATEQPIPDASALPLSTILRAKNRLSIYLFIFGSFFVVIALLIFSGEIVFTTMQSHASTIYIGATTLVINAIILLALLLLSVIGVIFASRQITQQLEFIEAGLLKRVGKKVTIVPWDEARLFAIIPASPAVKKTSSPPTNYELSSANEVLRWSASEHMGLFIGQTAVATDEYRQQMQALLSVIAARTGLPLYDLR